MRIIAGKSKGSKLKVPTELTRPSTDRLRSALFSILYGRIEGAMVLDLYSGSGALALESLSRGAQSALCIDDNPQAIECIIDNAQNVGLADYLQTRVSKVLPALVQLRGSAEQFDLIFADPPYLSGDQEQDHVGALLDSEDLQALMGQNTVFIAEGAAPQKELAEGHSLTCIDRRNYGKSYIDFFQKRTS